MKGQFHSTQKKISRNWKQIWKPVGKYMYFPSALFFIYYFKFLSKLFKTAQKKRKKKKKTQHILGKKDETSLFLQLEKKLYMCTATICSS